MLRSPVLNVGSSSPTAARPLPGGVGWATGHGSLRQWFHRLVIRDAMVYFCRDSREFDLWMGLGSCRLSDRRINHPHDFVQRATKSVGGEGNVSTLFQIKVMEIVACHWLGADGLSHH